MKLASECAAALLTGLALWPGTVLAQFPGDEPALEAVITVDDRRHEGLIESESDSWVNLIEIRRRRGKPMYLVIQPIERDRVAKVVRLAPAERDALRRQVEQFVGRARIEAGRMEAVRLDESRRAGVRYFHYRGPWFALDASTDDDTARRIIVRVEQVFTAFRQILPPRQKPAAPLHLIVFGSMEEYQQYLAQLRLKISSPACFVENANLLLAGTELSLYSAELGRVAIAHEKLRKELETLEKQLPERLAHYGEHLRQSGLAPAEISKLLNLEKQRAAREITDRQRQVQASERKNARDFEKVTGRTFTRLYHEAFHAYLENYVFPRAKYQVPRWLNEGLAVMVEGGQLESGTLRIDAPEPSVLRRLKADLGARGLALADLLTAGPEAFLSPGDLDTAASQRYYAAAWGLVYYLSFEKNLLSGAALEEYVRPAAGATPTARFEKLVGAPLAPFEKAWRSYILALK